MTEQEATSNAAQSDAEPSVSSVLEALHLAMMAKKYASAQVCEEIDRRFSVHYSALGVELSGEM